LNFAVETIRMDKISQDEDQIRALIARQFTSLSWGNGTRPEWDAFAADFEPSAVLYPAARPVVPATVSTFVERMNVLSETTLDAFQEAMVGTTIHVFGGVAVAVAACEVTENQKDVSRTVEMMLLVKQGDAWRIAAQAWDKTTPTRPIPKEYLDDKRSRKPKDGGAA
jgi:hypothetical protein